MCSGTPYNRCVFNMIGFFLYLCFFFPFPLCSFLLKANVTLVSVGNVHILYHMADTPQLFCFSTTSFMLAAVEENVNKLLNQI